MRVKVTTKLALFIYCLSFLACGRKDRSRTLSEINPAELPYELHIMQSGHSENAWEMADLDNNGVSELVEIAFDAQLNNHRPNVVNVFEIPGFNPIEQVNFAGPIHMALFDIENDGKKEIFVSEQQGDAVFIHFYTPALKELKKFRAIERKRECERTAQFYRESLYFSRAGKDQPPFAGKSPQFHASPPT